MESGSRNLLKRVVVPILHRGHQMSCAVREKATPMRVKHAGLIVGVFVSKFFFL